MSLRTAAHNFSIAQKPVGVTSKDANALAEHAKRFMAGRCSRSVSGHWHIGGRQIAISSSSTPRVSFKLVDFYHKEARLIGVGEFPPPDAQAWPLEGGPQAYREIEAGRLKRKVVLVP